MSEEVSKPNRVAEAAAAVKGVVEAVPIYNDALQPAAKEVGAGLELVAKAVTRALIPIRLFVTGIDVISNRLEESLRQKLSGVPAAHLRDPDPSVAGPAIEAMRFSFEHSELRDMFENLIARSMDGRVAHTAHPGFVEILKQITPDEAKILRFMANRTDRQFALVTLRARRRSDGVAWTICANLSMIPEDAKCNQSAMGQAYVENLVRLGVLEIQTSRKLANESEYDRIFSEPVFKFMKDTLDGNVELEPEIVRQVVSVTTWGAHFVASCVGVPPPATLSSDQISETLVMGKPAISNSPPLRATWA